MKSRIKILFFQWKLVFGGTESALFDLLRMMNKDEFDITLFVMEEGGVWDQKFKDEDIRVIGPYTELNQKKASISVSKYIRWKKKIDKSIKDFCINLLDVCTTEKWDIVVAYHPTDYRLAVFQKNAKTVFYLHMDAENYPFLKKDLQESPHYYKAFDRIISVSDFVRKSFVRLSGIEDNVIVHYNPIDSDAVKRKANEDIDISIDGPYICSVGRLSIQKGFERLIRIHKRLVDEGFNYKLVIVGEGELREKIEKTIKEVGAEDIVVLAGFQENPYPIIKCSEMLVVSSFHEGLPVVSMESIVLGIPVVSSFPSVGELFDEEQCGLLTDFDDESLYQGILKMLSDKEFYQKVKEATKRRSAFFDGKRMTKEVEDEFKALYYEKTNYREKRTHVKKEIKKMRKTKDRDLRHLPNRVLQSILGERVYESIKSKIKKI